jgi:hypothetical protein
METEMRSLLLTFITAVALTGCSAGSDPDCDEKLGMCLRTADNGKPRLTGLDQAPPPPIPGDGDGDGWAECGTPGWPEAWPCDCGPDSPAIAPDEPEQCSDEERVDEDCDGLANELDVDEPATWGFDGDRDGFGKPFDLEFTSGDTDDTDAATFTGQGFFPGCDARVLAAAFLEELFGSSDADVDPRILPLVQVNYDADLNLVLDCDDDNTFVNPAATEVCDGADNDCDGDVDEGASDPEDFWVDGDGDGFGAGGAGEFCPTDVPDGWTDNDADCDDADPDVSPLAVEIPGDGIDQNCDGLDLCYQDLDLDGFGAGEPALTSNCWAEGWADNGDDCDDADGAIHPSAPEDACDGADNNCNTLIDGADTDLVGLTTFWGDLDGDGFGDVSTSTEACDISDGWSANADDCDDADGDVNPGATEVCDPMNVDEDCSGSADDADAGVTGETTWYADLDEDGFGRSSVARVSCEQPSRSSATPNDCDDADGDVNPGATEVPYDDVDNDCDPLTEDDVCALAELALAYYPGPDVDPTDDVQIQVKTVVDGIAPDYYTQWTTGSPEGTVVSTEGDGVTIIRVNTCVDGGAQSLWVRVVHNDTLHCENESIVLATMDGMLPLPVTYLIDPIDELCADQVSLAP